MGGQPWQEGLRVNQHGEVCLRETGTESSVEREGVCEREAAGPGIRVLEDGRRGVLQQEAARFLAAAGLPVPPGGEQATADGGRIVLPAADIRAWLEGRAGRPLERWAVPPP